MVVWNNIGGDRLKELLHAPAGSAGNNVYAQLKQQIVSLELPPGTTLSEKEMSIAFQVSRTPVRESFVRLAQESLRLHDGRSMFELDEEFHRILFEGCRKLGTWSVIQQMNAHLNRSRILWLKTDPHWEHLYNQHRQMFEAVRLRDESRADSVMREHLTLSIANLSVLKEKFPDFFITGQ